MVDMRWHLEHNTFDNIKRQAAHLRGSKARVENSPAFISRLVGPEAIAAG
jgi:hypothetical protein